jgi:hypothetical protein
MKDKYYTPTLEELISHVIKGEIVYADVYGNSRLLELPTENSILYLMAFLKCHANIVGRSIVDLDPDQFRIKYLDREDIESCGFDTEDNGECYCMIDMFDLYGLYPWEWDKGIKNQYKIILNGETLYRGIIKNISELKVLLKQLNVLPSSI